MNQFRLPWLPWSLSGEESMAKEETWVWSLNQEDALEKEMATHSSILAWEIPWTEWGRRASGILGPWPEVGPQLPALAARSPNPEMAREAPLLSALSDAYLGEKFLDHLVISCLIFWETATLCKRSCTVYPFIACIWGWHTQPSFGAHSYTVFLCFTE